MLTRLMDPHLAAAVRGALQTYLQSYDSQGALVTVTWLSAYIPYQTGTTLCSCFDTVGNRTTDPSCPGCYGRGVVGGYATGVVLALSLIPGQTREVQGPDGYLETQSGAIAYILEPTGAIQPEFKRDDLLVVRPDPLAVSANPDRRYVIADEIEPVHVLGHSYARRYFTFPIELGAIAYRVPVLNPTTVPSDDWGTI